MVKELAAGATLEEKWIEVASLLLSLASVSYAVAYNRAQKIGSDSPFTLPFLILQLFAEFSLRMFGLVMLIITADSVVSLVGMLVCIMLVNMFIIVNLAPPSKQMTLTQSLYYSFVSSFVVIHECNCSNFEFSIAAEIPMWPSQYIGGNVCVPVLMYGE
jgi:hypothetical protein